LRSEGCAVVDGANPEAEDAGLPGPASPCLLIATKTHYTSIKHRNNGVPGTTATGWGVLPDPLNSRNPPREVFAAHPEIFGDPLPIRGGWGYSMDDPVIIDKDDPIVPKGRRFDGVGVEYAFVDKRIHAELVFF
jgi:hypothetical protein